MSHPKGSTQIRVFGDEVLRRVLDLRGRKESDCRENYIMRNFLICTLRQISYCSCDKIKADNRVASISLFEATKESTLMTVFLQGVVQ
jgi:hypothetical protein